MCALCRWGVQEGLRVQRRARTWEDSQVSAFGNSVAPFTESRSWREENGKLPAARAPDIIFQLVGTRGWRSQGVRSNWQAADLGSWETEKELVPPLVYLLQYYLKVRNRITSCSFCFYIQKFQWPIFGDSTAIVYTCNLLFLISLILPGPFPSLNILYYLSQNQTLQPAAEARIQIPPGVRQM